MVLEINLNSENTIKYQLTPWDKRVFSKNTLEILSLQFDSLDKGVLLLKEFETKEKPDICYGRFKSSDYLLKKCLTSSGYNICEYSADLFLPNLHKYETPTLYKKRFLPIRLAESSDHDKIRSIVDSMFNYSRFHEDPLIEEHLANRRMEFWVDDLIKQGKELLIYQNSEGELISFVFCEEIEKKVSFMLGGSKNSKGILTPFFFSSVVDYYKKKNKTNSIQVKVSLANLVMVNLYLSLGFKIKQTLIDYHKHIK